MTEEQLKRVALPVAEMPDCHIERSRQHSFNVIAIAYMGNIKVPEELRMGYCV